MAGVGQEEPFTARKLSNRRAPFADLPALAPERGGSTLSGHSNCIPFRARRDQASWRLSDWRDLKLWL